MSTLTFDECCALVRAKCPDQYAQTYAKHSAHTLRSFALDHAGHSDPDEAIRTQCLYILNNMTSWRGEIAQDVRANLKRIAGTK